MLLFKILWLGFCFKMERKQIHHSTLITNSSEFFVCFEPTSRHISNHYAANPTWVHCPLSHWAPSKSEWAPHHGQKGGLKNLYRFKPWSLLVTASVPPTLLHTHKQVASLKVLPLFLALVENEVSDVRINVEVNQPVVRSPGWTGLIYTALVTTPVIKSEQSSNADAVSHQLEHLSISGRKLHLRSESAACLWNRKHSLADNKPKSLWKVKILRILCIPEALPGGKAPCGY